VEDGGRRGSMFGKLFTQVALLRRSSSGVP
jgi:hypothetical protein